MAGQEAPPQYYPPPAGYGYEDQKGYPPPQGQQGYPPQGYPPQQAYGMQPQPGGGVQYQQPVTVVVAGQRLANPPPDNMIFNIVVTIMCCWPIGIFAIMKSMACRDAIFRGDQGRAESLSREAKRLGFWTLGVGIAFVVLSVVLIVVLYAVILIPSWSSTSSNWD